MQTSRITWRRLFLPLAFTVLCVVLAVGVWRSFGGSVPLEAEGYRFGVSVPQAESLFGNTPVLTSGVRVGRIVRVESEKGRGELTVELDPEFAPVRRGARVMARTKTLLGEGYLELVPGDPDAPPVADGGRLPASRAVAAQRLDDVLETFDPATRRQFRRLFAGTERAFRGRAPAINAILGRARPVTADLRAVVDVVHGQRPDLRRMIDGSADLFGALARREASLSAAMTETGRVLSVTARRDAALRSTIAALPPFLTALREATGRIDAVAPDLRRALAALRPTAPLLAPALDALVRDTPAFRRLFDRLPQLIVEGEKALPALARVLDDAGPALEDVHLGARQAAPVLRLASAARHDLVGALASSGAMANGRLVGQEGQINGFAAGWLTVWNEIVGGWTKKLPTNRPNPYPAPGGSGKIARGGLEAYDCRHLGNRLIVPPIGSGAPPCRTQKPWMLGDDTMAYPRLLLDPP
ncbi:MAG: MlaD family protein [Solirubrobacteraceae bacterium]